jgi:hypothetical protein
VIWPGVGARPFQDWSPKLVNTGEAPHPELAAFGLSAAR